MRCDGNPWTKTPDANDFNRSSGEGISVANQSTSKKARPLAQQLGRFTEDGLLVFRIAKWTITMVFLTGKENNTEARHWSLSGGFEWFLPHLPHRSVSGENEQNFKMIALGSKFWLLLLSLLCKSLPLSIPSFVSRSRVALGRAAPPSSNWKSSVRHQRQVHQSPRKTHVG